MTNNKRNVQKIIASQKELERRLALLRAHKANGSRLTRILRSAMGR